MNYKTQTEQLVRSYENKVAWGNADHEEALHEAINAAFPNLPDEARAELFCRIEEQWEANRSGFAPRKLWIGSIVSSYMSERTGKAFSEVKTNG